MQKEKEKFENQLVVSCSSFVISFCRHLPTTLSLMSGVLPNLKQTRVRSAVLTELFCWLQASGVR